MRRSRDEALNKSTAGFIGLGTMGKGMAKNLLKAGFGLVVYDVRKELVDELQGLGATGAGSPREVAIKSDNGVITMVRDNLQTEEVILGETGVLQGIERGAIIIMSTIAPSLARDIAQKVMKEKGLPVLDAPVSGGWMGADAGILSIMVGGPEDTFKQYQPLLEAMGRSITYCGGTGMGLVAKLTNNTIETVNMVGAFEGLALALKAGVDKEVLFKVWKASTAESWVLEHWDFFERARRDTKELQLIMKDMGLAVDLARQLGISMPATDLCSKLDLYIRE